MTRGAPESSRKSGNCLAKTERSCSNSKATRRPADAPSSVNTRKWGLFTSTQGFSPAWEVTPDTLRMKKSKNHPGFAMDRASCNDTRTVGRATPPRTGCGETLSLTKWRNYKRIKAACQQNGKENFHS